MTNVLQNLVSDEFIASAGVVTSARSLRRHLTKSTFVDDLRSALRGGSISENDVREFVHSLMGSFERSVRFPFELALAALAIVLETRKTEFAEEFLLDLARLNISEMEFAPTVARESLRVWSRLPWYEEKSRQFRKPLQSQISTSSRWRIRTFVLAVSNRQRIVPFTS